MDTGVHYGEDAPQDKDKLVERTPSREIDVNHPASIIAAIYLGVIGAAVFIVQPGFVQGLVAELGYDEQQAGYVVAIEVWGIALTSIFLAMGGYRFSWERILTLSIILFFIGNICSTFTNQITFFSSSRFLAGLGAGGLVSLTFTIIGLTRFADRNFGYLIAAVLTYGALGLWIMPTAFSLVGLDGVIIFFALFGASGWWCIKLMPNSGEAQLQVEEDSFDLGSVARIFAVVSMFFYFFAQGVIWAYLFLIGIDGGVSEQGVANGLMASQFFGIAGAMVAVVLGRSFGRLTPLALGILGGAGILLLLLDPFSAFLFALIVCVYNFAWNVTHPFLLGAMASFDKTGRVVVYAVAAQMLGLATGPAVGAMLLGDGDYHTVVLTGIMLFVFSYLLILQPLLAHRRLVNLN